MKTKKPIVYVAHKMTGRYCDELVREAELTYRVLSNYGFKVLDPIIIENVPDVHEILEQTDGARLARYWVRDKECLKECHLVLDYMSCNKSDGVGVELGLTRFGYWKPVFRVFPTIGISISRIEYDSVFNNLNEAALNMMVNFGSRHQILKWRLQMLQRSLLSFIGLQIKFLWDLI